MLALPLERWMAPGPGGRWLAGGTAASAAIAAGLIAWAAFTTFAVDQPPAIDATADLQRASVTLFPTVIDAAPGTTDLALAAESEAFRKQLAAVGTLIAPEQDTLLSAAFERASGATEAAFATMERYTAGAASPQELVRSAAALPLALEALHMETHEHFAGQVDQLSVQQFALLSSAALFMLTLFVGASFWLHRVRWRERRSAVLLEAMLDQTSSGIVIIDGSGRLEFMNRGMEVLLGYPLEELRHDGLRGLIPRDDLRRIRDRAEEEASSGQIESPQVITATHRDGSIRQLELGTTAMITLDGRTLYVGAMRDVTAEIDAQAERDRIDAWLETILIGAPVTLWAIDRHGVYTFAVGRESAEAFTERREHTLIGRNIRDVYRETPQVITNHERALAGAEIRATITVDGRHFDTHLSPLRDAGGEVQGVVGVATDVTARHVAEEAQRRTEGRYRTLFESSTYGLAFLDLNGHFQLTNRRMADLLNVTDEDLRGGWAGDWVARQALWDISEEVATMLQHPEDHPHPVRYRRRIERPSGGPIDLEGIVSVVREGGNPTGLLVEAHDVTEELRLREQLSRSEKSEALGRMVAGIAHDFNNLLAIIGGAVDQEMTGQPEPSYWMNTARQATDRAADLVRGLLQFARSEQPQRQPERMDLLVQRTVELAEQMLDARIELEVQIAPDLPSASVDATQIGQVLMNLVVNARDAVIGLADNGPPPGYRPTIRVLLDHTGDRIALTVADNGLGMSPQVRERVFDPFFTTKRAGRGIGLGLATSYGIVESHGGTISVDSSPGAGTTFNVRLPISGQPSVPTPPPEPVMAPEQHFDLLLVDDERQILELNAMILTDAGYAVRVADNGYEAVRAAQADPPDAVVLDIKMPTLDGWETLTMLRRVVPDLPVLVATGYATAERARAHGANGLLRKPYRADDLLREVRRVLADGAAAQADATGDGGADSVERAEPVMPDSRTPLST